MSALKYLFAIALSIAVGFGAGHLAGWVAEFVIRGLGATDHAAMLGFLLCRYGGTFAGVYYGYRLGGRFA
jgi:hypothetical protein